MKRKTILTLWITGFIIALIGAGMLIPAIVTASHTCTPTYFGGHSCSLPLNDPLTFVGLGGGVLLLIAGILATIAWIGALVRSARMQTWVWFVIILLFHGLGTLIYLIAGPREQPAQPKADSLYTQSS